MSARQANPSRPQRTSRQPALEPRRFNPRLLAAVAGLLLLHFILAVTSAWNKSVTYDEIAHLTRGVSYTVRDDYRLGPPHPPFAHYWAAIPLRFMRLRFPPENQEAWRKSNMWSIGAQFFFNSKLNNPADQMLWRGRAMIALLSAALGGLVFIWSREIFGTAGGLLSLAIYAVSPTVLAHGALVTTDLVSALFFTAATYALWKLTHRLTLVTLLAAMFCVGMLFLSKASAAIMVFVGLALIVIRVAAPQPLTVRLFGPQRVINSRVKRGGILLALAPVVGIAAITMLWAGYGFRWSPFRNGASTPEGYKRDAEAGRYDYYAVGTAPGKSQWEYQARQLEGRKLDLLRKLHEWKLVPDAYAYSLLYMLQGARGRDAFLNGERSLFGWHTFFPYAFLVKTPLPLFGLMGAALAAALLRPKDRSLRVAALNERGSEPRPSGSGSEIARSLEYATTPPLDRPSLTWLTRLYPTLPLWTLIAAYSVASVRSTLNIGHRHLLPMEPAIYILCGAAALWWQTGRRALQAIPVALAGLLAAASVSMFPHYLAYFNWIVGGPRNGHKHLVDSSLDWGQDLPALSKWLKENAGGKQVYLRYFGMGSPEHDGIREYKSIIPRLPKDRRGDFSLRGGVYCVSATSFQQVYELTQADVLAVTGKKEPMPVDWSPPYEQFYQRLRPLMQQFESLPDDTSAREAFLQKTWGKNAEKTLNLYQKLRFMRLCAHLRRREPDAMPGYSILVYALSDADVDRFVNGPPP